MLRTKYQHYLNYISILYYFDLNLKSSKLLLNPYKCKSFGKKTFANKRFKFIWKETRPS